MTHPETSPKRVPPLVVELRLPAGLCPLSRHTGRFGVELRYVESAPIGGDTFLELLEVRGPQARAYVDAMRDDGGVDALRVVQEQPDRVVCQTVLGARCIRTAIAERGWLPLQVRARGGEEIVSAVVQSPEDARALVDAMRKEYGDCELVRIAPCTPEVLTGHAPDAALTPAQARVLQLALSRGYFEQPRGQSAQDMAAELGIDRSTFTRQLRAALKRVLAPLGG